MNRILSALSALCLLTLIGCGGGGGASSNSNETRAVSGSGGTITINSSNKTDLSISGLGNTINIESDLGSLAVSGLNNLLIFSDNIVVDSCALSGSDNMAQKGTDVIISCIDSGLGNSGF